MAEDHDQCAFRDLQEALSASQRTVDVLKRRVERFHVETPGDAPGSLNRALAGMQRELAERAASLADSDARYRALYESSPDPLLTIDAQGTVLAVNPRCLSWLDRESDALIGSAFYQLFEPKAQAALARVAGAGWSWVSERSFALADGRVVHINAARIGSGGRALYHVTLHDLTAERALEHASSQLRRMEALAELAGAIARELNDPMSIVQGRLELLLDLGVDDPVAVRKHLEVALRHARRVTETLHNLRLVGRASPMRLESVPVRDAIDAGLSLLGPRSDRVDVGIEPAELTVATDLATVARVLASLMHRALELSSRNGGVRITATGEADRISIRVSAWAARRPDARRSAPQGVSIDRTLAAAVGGRLSIESTDDGQVVLHLVLPQPAPRRARRRPARHQVLVVGSEQLHERLKGLIAREGYALHHLRTADEAVAWLAVPENEAIAVVTQLILDGRSGLSLAEHAVRAHPRLRGRVLLVSKTPVEWTPPSVVALTEPLQHQRLLEALGTRPTDQDSG